jgi:HK97 family phage prohead protease
MPVLQRSDVSPGELSVKSIAGQLSVDEAEGIVECFVSGVGNKDGVGDIIVPGAFDSSLKRRKPRVVWGHDWNHPIGKVLEIYEVSPGDFRLPPKMKAAGIGGLYAKVQFNLKSEKGKEAFSNIIFFGEDQEWSIGYKTLDSEYDGRKQANVLKELELFEVSPVLHGANNLTATISIKSGEGENEDEAIRRGLSMLKAFAEENPGWEPEVPGVKRDFSASERREAADAGAAMPDGSFPIKNASDLRNAIRLAGHSKNPDAAKAHIKKRARALGLTSLLPDDWKSLEEKVDVPGSEGASIGALTGGRGPRRGNLEDLLDYWRPIMKKPGGFRRCLVILADHPELGPLPNLCAWLHHETTGKWPGERNHHGGGKSENDDFETPESHPLSGTSPLAAKALSDHFGVPVRVREVKSDSIVFDMVVDGEPQTFMVSFKSEGDDFLFGKKQHVHAETTYRPFDDQDDHMPVKKPHACKEGEPCECGGACSTEKSLELSDEAVEALQKALDDAVDVKVGRVLSSRNVAKLKQAAEILNDVLSSAPTPDGSTVDVKDRVIVRGAGLKDAVEALSEFHGGYVEELGATSFAVEVQSDAHFKALERVVAALDGGFIIPQNGTSSLEAGDSE